MWREFGLQNAKLSDIPLRVGYGKAEATEPLRDNIAYRKLIGSLLYIALNTRPDIAASVAIDTEGLDANAGGLE